ncbi:MAG: ABC transporter substrate-binding protein, partial [Alphaproteobacteria bacterium]
MALAPTQTQASQERLVIATRAEPNSLDPQYSITGTNQATAMHMFETLLKRDENLRIGPGLATVFRPIDAYRWEVVLREDVRFHDGSPLTAKDVAFSLERASRVPFSPASFAPRVKMIERIDILDAHRLYLVTREP